MQSGIPAHLQLYQSDEFSFAVKFLVWVLLTEECAHGCEQAKVRRNQNIRDAHLLSRLD